MAQIKPSIQICDFMIQSNNINTENIITTTPKLLKSFLILTQNNPEKYCNDIKIYRIFILLGNLFKDELIGKRKETYLMVLSSLHSIINRNKKMYQTQSMKDCLLYISKYTIYFGDKEISLFCKIICSLVDDSISNLKIFKCSELINILETMLIFASNKLQVEQTLSLFKDIPTNTFHLCKICFEVETPNCVIMPCGHASFCSKCLMSIRDDKCPYCRIHIHDIIKIFH